MGPVLENPPLSLESIQVSMPIMTVAAPEHVMMGPFNNRNGIDLNITQMLDGRLGRFNRMCAVAVAIDLLMR